MIGILLAGGRGSRLWPLTHSVSKQLLPVFDKPLIYYPLSTLMLAGIRDIILISTPEDSNSFQQLLGDGSRFGIRLNYRVQNEPRGIAESFLLCADLIEGEKCALILGDNLFYGQGLGTQLSNYLNIEGAQIFAYRVSNPKDYGVVEINEKQKIVGIQEKPQNPKSNLVVPGLYFYDESVTTEARKLFPSLRGELEITDLNLRYLEKNNLKIQVLPRGTAWFDTGDPKSLHDATSFVRTIEERQGMKIACLEEIAYRMNWITKEELESEAKKYNQNGYGLYLNEVANLSTLDTGY
jgi:glucose-1-phosphate thymidylyltransferase